MKKFLILVLISTSINFGCHKKKEFAKIEFAETEHDFGDINQGEKRTNYFSFSNTGNIDLQITDALGSCGCTVPEYPKNAIKKGEKGIIKVTFNSAGKQGEQHKTVTLKTNTEKGFEVLKIKANVKPIIILK